MNNIESNVRNAQEYVEKAKEDTKAAVKVQKTSKVVSNTLISPQLLSKTTLSFCLSLFPVLFFLLSYFLPLCPARNAACARSGRDD